MRKLLSVSVLAIALAGLTQVAMAKPKDKVVIVERPAPHTVIVVPEGRDHPVHRKHPGKAKGHHKHHDETVVYRTYEEPRYVRRHRDDDGLGVNFFVSPDTVAGSVNIR